MNPIDHTPLLWRDRVAAADRAWVSDLEDALARTSSIAVVLDVGGRIVACNSAWREAASDRAPRSGDRSTFDVGADYLAVCERAAHDGDGSAGTAAEGIRSVLRGDQRQFTLDYECSGPDERRWYTMRVAQLVGPTSGALVTHVDITSVRAAELAVRGELHHLWTVADPAADVVFLLDEAGHVISRTRDRSEPHQWPLVGDASLDFVHPDDRPHVDEQLVAVRSTPGRRVTAAFRARRSSDEAWRHYNVAAIDMIDDPLVGGIVVEIHEVTDWIRDASERVLARTLQDDAMISAIATDERGIITAINPGGRRLWGVDGIDPVGRAVYEFAWPVCEVQVSDLLRTLERGEQWTGEIDVRRRDGSIVRAFAIAAQSEHPELGFTTRSCLAIDLSQQRDLLASLEAQRSHDELTGLPNAVGLIEHLEQLTASLGPGEHAIVAKLDLDRFTEVNTLHGLHVGDALLRRTAAILERAAEGGFVARLYGDVFVVVSRPGRPLAGFGQALQEAISVVEATDGLSVHVGSSVGIRIIDGDDTDPARVIADTRVAVDAAKHLGGNAVRTYDDDLRRSVDEQARLRADLVGAVARDEMVVVYQPIVRLDDGVVVGAEALARWSHPTLGWIPPDVFIELAEKSSIIHDIGAFVLEDACRRARDWARARPQDPPTVAVNISVSQLADAGLPSRIRRLLDRYELEPATITLELTESMVMDGPARVQLVRLRETGVRIAIDDFGTGYSSLGRLKELPLDVVKFDRSFISGIAGSAQDAAIVRSVVGLAEVLELDIVAEGVETAADAVSVHATGCRLGQGYLWSPPVAPDDFGALLRRTFPLVPVGSTGPD